MLSETLIELFDRDLNRLKKEIASYQNENNLWIVENSISNSAGNLCLHVIGNLNHFIGAVLGNTGYIRERDKEFSQKNLPVKDMTDDIDELIETINNTLSKIDDKEYMKVYPINVFQKEMTTEFFVIHLSTHLNYHLGQINYHRRLLDK